MTNDQYIRKLEAMQEQLERQYRELLAILVRLEAVLQHRPPPAAVQPPPPPKAN